ncbi:Sec8 exocyst complex component-specific domain-containing protein [Syncephalis plumigaleata]|nr:Sec8 exocyst complex component-specific domain-containing protein [Syncephalis plumigaleata]
MAPYDDNSQNPYGISRTMSQNSAFPGASRQSGNVDLTRTYSQSTAIRDGNPRSPPATGERPMNPYRQRQLERSANNQSSGSIPSQRGGASASGSIDYGSEAGGRENPYARSRRQQDSFSQSKKSTFDHQKTDSSSVNNTNNPFAPSAATTTVTATSAAASTATSTPSNNYDQPTDAALHEEDGTSRGNSDKSGGRDGGGRGGREHRRMSTYGGRYAAGGGSGHEHTKSNASQRSMRSSRNSSFSQGGRRRFGEDTEDGDAYRQLQQEQMHPDGVFHELPVLDEVLRKFPELEHDNFNAIDLAMGILDRGRRRVDSDAFYALLERLEQVVNTVVRTHHRSFTDTIDAYSSVLEAVTIAQKEASELKADMIECKDRLRLKRGDLLQWWTRSQQHREMIRLLDEIDDLKKVPERIEQLRQKEEHTAAVAQVVKALERVEHGPLAGIGALTDLKKQLLSERNTMHERLIEELLKMLYLKNVNLSNDELQNEMNQLSVYWQDEAHSGTTRGPLAKLTVLLSCLNELRKLPEALETVRQRMPTEIHQLIDRAISKLAHDGDGPVELLHLMQTQLLRVIEIHRQIYIKAAEFQMTDTDAAIVTELGLSSYKESWMTVQNELKSFFYDYLSEDQRNVDPHTTPAASINEALRGKRKTRDQRKKLFRLLDTDVEVDFADAYDTVQQRIAITFPNLHGDNDDNEGTERNKSTITNDASIAFAAALLSGEQALGRHVLLAKPGPVVVAKLFRPVLELLERARRIDR